MDSLTFVIKLVEFGAWPLVVFFGYVWFEKGITEVLTILAKRLRDSDVNANALGVSFSLTNNIREVAKEHIDSKNESRSNQYGEKLVVIDEAESLPGIRNIRVNRAGQALDEITLTYDDLSSSATAAVNAPKDANISKIADLLVEKHILRPSEALTFLKLGNIRDEAAKPSQVPFTDVSSAYLFANVAGDLKQTILKATEKQNLYKP